MLVCAVVIAPSDSKNLNEGIVQAGQKNGTMYLSLKIAYKIFWQILFMYFV